GRRGANRPLEAQRPGYREALRQWASVQARCLSGRDHDPAQGPASLPDGPGAKARRRAFPQRCGLGHGAPADGAARPGAILGPDRRSRQARFHTRRAAAFDGGIAMATVSERAPERQAFYDRIAPSNLAPLWEQLHSLVTPEPTTACLPALWRYEEIRPHLMQAGGLST